jgi:hypothetical protein
MRGYDAWLTTQPEQPDIPMPGDRDYPVCGNREGDGCGAFLSITPDWTSPNEFLEECLGYGPGAAPLAYDMGWEPNCPMGTTPHSIHKWTNCYTDTEHRICTKCLKHNRKVV